MRVVKKWSERIPVAELSGIFSETVECSGVVGVFGFLDKPMKSTFPVPIYFDEYKSLIMDIPARVESLNNRLTFEVSSGSLELFIRYCCIHDPPIRKGVVKYLHQVYHPLLRAPIQARRNIEIVLPEPSFVDSNCATAVSILKDTR